MIWPVLLVLAVVAFLLVVGGLLWGLVIIWRHWSEEYEPFREDRPVIVLLLSVCVGLSVSLIVWWVTEPR